MRISPADGVSNPAISRSVVVLPQPDGPRMLKNSPRFMSRSTALTAVSPLNTLNTLRSSTSNFESL
ncbi:protein of unknown function [Limnospira indica PCC 8005]|uniref:Uncharacterized protein n=1 Tax=Limnospira indica PCC 8005 TaxID=376219 RepID=A0A9P1KL78_9CYAN|nr:protein of unknown function [Limnospira indica PCC 8005]